MFFCVRFCYIFVNVNTSTKIYKNTKVKNGEIPENI